jgi:DNA polymerase-3 subunit alpha
METCESIGLLKVDFLGLSTLTYMRRACDLIAKHRGIHYDMSNIPYKPSGDPEQDRMLKESFEMLGRGETVGVFQVESSGMQGMLRDMRPTRFEHIVAGISLYRPGPMDYIPTFNKRLRGDEPVLYHHEKLRPILEETYGIMVYQEQIMRVGRELFGYSLGDADLMRKAVSKKKREDLVKHREIFLKNGPEYGVSEEAAGKIFDDIEFFANYGFNRAHASDYAVITCQSAFLKAHYPAEYMAALLSVYYDDAAKVTTFLIECKRLNIQILPPDINHSELDFDIQANPDGTQGIRFGMAAIKNAGVGALQHIIEERNANGQFANLEDFCSRVDLRVVGKRTVESLIKVGALKSIGDGEDNRKQLIAALDRIMSYSGDRHKAKEVGQVSLFGDTESSADDLLRNLPQGGAVSVREMLNWEKELLGLYISSHPIDPLLAQLGGQTITSTLELKAEDANNEMPVTFVGLVAALRKIPTKNHDMMGVATLEDRFGTIDTVLFPRTWNKFGEMLVEGAVIKIIGKLDLTRNDPQIICELVDDKFISVVSDDPSVNAPIPSFTPSALSEAMAVWDEQEVEPPQPPPFTPTNGNSNGNANGNGHLATSVEPPSFDELPPLDDDEEFVPFVPEHIERPKEPLKLRFRFLRNGDEAKDRRRLERLVGVITSQHGQDHFEIVLVTEGVATHLMEFPNRTTCYGDKLVKQLGEIPGVELDPVPSVS